MIKADRSSCECFQDYSIPGIYKVAFEQKNRPGGRSNYEKQTKQVVGRFANDVPKTDIIEIQ